MKNYLLTAFIVIVLLLLPKAAFASCIVPLSVKESANGANLVFVGTVTKITPAQIATATYSIMAKKPKWEKRFERVELVTFSVSEAFKGVLSETIEIVTSANGDAGFKFEGGTWLKEGLTYLVYAYKRELAGTIPNDLTEENYGKAIAAQLRAMHKAFPKQLAAEINEFNSKISLYFAGICGRTTNINNKTEELEQTRKMFPEALRFATQTNAKSFSSRR